MIGRRLRPRRGVALGLAATLLLGAVYAARSADPFVADPVGLAALRSTIASERSLADQLLTELRDALTTAVDEGRRGAALTVQGTELPGPHLAAAAQLIGAGDHQVMEVRAILQQLGGTVRIVKPSASAIGLALKPGDLTGIGAQMLTASDAADAFSRMRRAAESTLVHLEGAFAAVDARNPAQALAAIDAAEVTLGQVRNWPGQLQTLPIWTQATGDLLSALRAMAIAISHRDSSAAQAAEKAYRTAAASAHRADLALALAIAEGGSGVSGPPLAAAAAALQTVQDAIANLRSILA